MTSHVQIQFFDQLNDLLPADQRQRRFDYPFIKQRYADLCFDSGMLSTDILDLYLSLAQENPDRAAEYYEKVSSIYADQGNQTEAQRFRAIAEKMTQGQ